MMSHSLSILGSTGSIGTQALEVCKAHKFTVCGLAAYQNIDLLEQQIRLFRPKKVCIYDDTNYLKLKQNVFDCSVSIVTGMEGLCEVASIHEADIVLNAVVGMIGLQPTLTAIEAKKQIALANKETLVTGGKLVMEAAKKHQVHLYPVDSEHSAIFQALQGNRLEQVNKVYLTASGGPFFGKTQKELEHVSLEDALRHPNWSMGSKITIDSATLVNKGLEFIEAMWLFDLKPEQIEIVIHRESIVHSAVEYLDHSIIAQLGTPDMKIPIQYALTYPERLLSTSKPLNLFEQQQLTFQKPDIDTFIGLKACIKAAKLGGLYPTVVNGANEQAVSLFLQKKISFLEIGKLVYQSLSLLEDISWEKQQITLSHIMQTDKLARAFVNQQINQSNE